MASSFLTKKKSNCSSSFSPLGTEEKQKRTQNTKTKAFFVPVLVFFLLFIPSCSLFQREDPYKWIPPEKKVSHAATDDGYDPASGMSYEEYLCTLDAPIVVSYERLINGPLWNMSDELTNRLLSQIRYAPHVTNVSFPTLLHWLTEMGSEKQESTEVGRLTTGIKATSMKESTLMIGQYQGELTEDQLSEGSVWKNTTECCINHALLEKLLARNEPEFNGVGDSLTVVERIYHKGYISMPDGTKREVLMLQDSFEFSFTVTGVVEEETAYSNSDAYGLYHIYAPIEIAKAMIVKHNFNHPNQTDEAMYLVSKTVEKLAVGTQIFRRPAADDPTKTELRLPGNRIIPEEEWLSYFEDVPVNAGYVMEITLDSGKGYAEFLEYMDSLGSQYTARYYYNFQYRVYEVNKENNRNNPNWVDDVNMPQILEEIAADGELDEWYYYRLVPRVIRPLRVAP